MSRSRYRIFETEHPYFLTNTIVAWLPVFAIAEFAQVILDSWKFLQRERGIEIFGFVIMENHLHWIARGTDLSAQVGRFKSHTARVIVDGLEKKGFRTILEALRFHKQRFKADQQYQLWQEGSHPQQIGSDEMMLQKLEYMHNNPLRRGYVDRAEHWRYSSARCYLGQQGVLDVTTNWR